MTEETEQWWQKYPLVEPERTDPRNPMVQPPLYTDTGIDFLDLGKSFAGGLGRGAAGLAGLPGEAQSVIRSGAAAVGVPPNIMAPYPGIHEGPPGAAEVQSGLERVTGPFYKPKTTGGEYMSTIGEFAPGALAGRGGVGSRIFGTAVPAVMAESAGQLTKGMEAEPYARAIAGIGGGLVAPRAITPFPAPPQSAARQRAVAALDREGIPMWAGQRTGSNALQWLEAAASDMPLASGTAQARNQAITNALGEAVTKRAFDPAALERSSSTRPGLPPGETSLPAADVMAKGKETLQDMYDALSRRNRLHDHGQLQMDMFDAQANYERRALESQRPGGARDIATIRQEIQDKLKAGNGSMAGDEYQTIRSDLGTHARTAASSNPKLGVAFKDMQSALDRAMFRGLSPEDAAAWQLNNKRYAIMKQLEAPVAAAQANEGFTPAALARGVRSGRAGQAAVGAGDLDELATAAAMVLKQKPSSGTQQRTMYANMLNPKSLISAGGGGLLGSIFGPAGSAVGAALPHAGAYGVVSGPGQRYLANQTIPVGGRDALTRILLQQAGSLPED